MSAVALRAVPPHPDEGPTVPSVVVDGDRIRLDDLVVQHGEAAALLGAELEQHGAAAAIELIAKALPVGLIAVTMSASALDTGAVSRTLDDFAQRVDDRSNQALARLEDTVTRLRSGEDAVAAASEAVRHLLTALPQQVESGLSSALSGGTGDIRAAVAEAARHVQAAGLAELNAALRTHSASVEHVLTLDRESPISTLRQDLLTELGGVRREITQQVNDVRALVEASQAVKQAAVKTTRAAGAAWEHEAMSLASSVVANAGDLFDLTAGQPGRGTTSRAGDAVATLNQLITGANRVRIVLEAKHRSKAMTSTQLRAEVRKVCEVREAAGCLILVPEPDQVPGGGLFARIDDNGFVVASSDPDTVSLVYLVMREIVAITSNRAGNVGAVDADALRARVNAALNGLAQFDEVARLANQASRNLEDIKKVGLRCRDTIRGHLTATLDQIAA